MFKSLIYSKTEMKLLLLLCVFHVSHERALNQKCRVLKNTFHLFYYIYKSLLQFPLIYNRRKVRNVNDCILFMIMNAHLSDYTDRAKSNNTALTRELVSYYL